MTTALMAAVILERVEVVEALLRNGGRPCRALNMADRDGNTPLMVAAAYRNVAIVTMLLNAGANKYAKNKHGISAIDVAEDCGNPAIAALIK